MKYPTVCLLQLLQLVASTLAGAGNWTKPSSNAPSFTDTYVVNERIYVSWLSLNDSTNDLWLTRYDPTVDTFSLRLAVAQNVSVPGSYEWTIAVSSSEIAEDTRFILQFLPTGSAYDPTHLPQLPSPAFNLITVNQQSQPNGTVGAPSVTATATATTATSTQANSTSATSSSQHSADSGSGQVPGGPPAAKFIAIGVAVGMGFLALGSAFGAYFAVRVYRRRRPSTASDSSQEKITGPYEVLGNSRQPTEMGSKESMVRELTSPVESFPAYEVKRTSIYELNSTKKQPGLHELPG